MSDTDLEQRLSRISTLWTVVFQAHGGANAADAQSRLVRRYGRAIYRYLLGAVRDPDAAEELAQEFALSLVRGAFKRVSPERGRFRDYVKAVLSNAVTSYRRRQQRQPLNAESVVLQGAAAPPEEVDSDADFLQHWREELLARTWEALQRAEQNGKQQYHTLLHFRSSHPELSSADMAREFSVRLGRAVSADAIRQTLHRARELFAQLLLEEVGTSLETDDLDRVEQELIDLELLPFCQDAVRRQRQRVEKAGGP